MTKDTDKEKKRILKYGIWAVVFIVVVWIVNLIFGLSMSTTEDGRGTLGDVFGASNALFSGLAMAGMIVAILMQSKELELQREELRETKEELKRTAEANLGQLKIQMLSTKIQALNKVIDIKKNQKKKKTKNMSIATARIEIPKMDEEIQLLEDKIEDLLHELELLTS